MQRWHYQFEKTSIPKLEHQLEWALQHQNARFARSFVAMRPRIVAGLAAFGLALLALLALLDRRILLDRPVFYGAVLAVLIVCVIVPRRPRRERPARHEGVGASLARQAAAHYRKPAQQAPYTIDYTFDGDEVHAHVDKLALDRKFSLRSARLVLHTDAVIYAFRYRWSFHPFRFVYVSGEPELRAILDALDRLAIPHERLEGPSEQYVAPIPRARASS